MLRFRVLGPLQVLADRAPVQLGAPKQRMLLAYLLLARRRFVPREELIDAVWGEDPPASAVASLHVYVHGLRRALGAERIETRGLAYRIHLEREEFDLERFERAVEQARRSLEEGGAERAAAVLREALELWEGPPLGDLPAEAFLPERQQLSELRLSALELLLEADLARGQHEAVIAELSPLVAEHPYRERLREQQILALYRAGRQKDALEAYREARRVLVDELGIEPGLRLRQLEAAVLRQAPALAAPAPEERRAKIVLPAAPTRLIGRERELEDILSLFGEDGARLVTLTGPGGTGKTRLSIAAAEQLGEKLPDGARFVDLSPVPEPALMLATIAAELEVPPGPLTSSLGEALRPLSMLLVLDNLERLLAAATAISDLLTAAPRLLVLVTSRAPLRLRAEHEYRVPPLALPEPRAALEVVAENEAVRLLTERARAVNRSCTLNDASAPVFVHICRRLDGLPLAIELAASRMRRLSPEAVAEGLDRALDLLVEGPLDLPARQQTLRATLDWSYELLDEHERQLFARLAAFAGSFSAQDVEAVTRSASAEPLARLAEANLVRQLEPMRYTMLETIREFAAECLERQGESETVRSSHSRHFLALAERAHEAIMGGEQAPSAYRSLEQAHDNLRAALVWAADSGELELEVRLACALRQFWLVKGHLAEGRAFFERAVAATSGQSDTLRAQALMHGGPFLYRQGELALAQAWWEEALALLNRLGDAPGAARCAGELGAVAFSEGQLDRAAELYTGSAEGFAKLGDRMRLAIVSSNLAEVEAQRGNLSTAIEHSERAVAIDRELKDPETLAVALHTLARLRQKAGETDTARRLFAECLTHAQAIGYREVIAHCLQAAAEFALADGKEAERPARLLAIARATLTEMGALLQGLEDEGFRRTASLLESRLSPERFSAIEHDAAGAPLDTAVGEALVILRADSAVVW